MNEMTMLLFLLSIGVFLLTFYMRKPEPLWLCFFISVCSTCLALLDESLSDDELMVLVSIEIFVMLTTSLKVFRNEV